LREGGAAGRCALGLLRGLRKHGVDVRAFAAREPWAGGDVPPADAPVTVVDLPGEQGTLAQRLRSLAQPLGQLGRGEFAERVRLASTDVDVVHLDEIFTARCRVARPAVLHLHYLARLDRPFAAPWSAELRQIVEFARAERAALAGHRHVVASSPVVAAEIRRRAPRAEVTLVPFCLDPEDYRPALLDGPPVAGIIGTAAWPPTAGALRRLVAEVWPEVLRRAPEARLRIAGRGSSRLGLEDVPGVEVVGEVPSAVEFLRGLSLLLYPLSRGSGVKVKTLESLALGLPVVTTAAGAEGLDGGGGVVVAEENDALVEAAVAILRDPGERRERGAAARAAFEARYTPRVATEPLVELYRRISS
jgi:glycosyltransferase involved in cell wall biosynthesis